MAVGNDNVPQICFSEYRSEVGENTEIIEEGPQICPLCCSQIRTYFINFNEKLLMCSNTECEFPFGYEDLQFIKVDNEICEKMEVSSIKYNMSESLSTACSVTSTAAWIEIDKINTSLEEDSQLEKERDDFTKAYNLEKQNETVISKDYNQILRLQTQLHDESEVDSKKVLIKNQMWIEKLKQFENLSGIQLLKPEEVKQLKKKEAVLGMGELKIDIDNNNKSMIKIEITNTGPA